MPQPATAVLEQICKGQLAPLYFVYGEEPFLIDQIAEAIEENALSEQERQLNQTVLYGRDTSLQQVLELARRFPMMGQRQVILVHEAQDLQGFTTDAAKQQLLSYVNALVPTTVLVLSYKKKAPRSHTAVLKAIDDKAVLVESKPVYESKLPDWVRSFATAEGLKLNSKAVELLVQNVGADLSRIANELRKLKVSVPGVTEVTAEMISEHVGISREYNNWELQAAIARKQPDKVLRILLHFRQNPNSNPAIVTVSTLFNFFSKVLVLQQHRSLPDKEAQQLIGANYYSFADYSAARQRFTKAQTLMAIESLYQTDLKMKGMGAQTDPAMLLFECCMALLHHQPIPEAI